MKRLILFLAANLIAIPGYSTPVSIEVKNVRKGKGPVMVSVFAKRATWDASNSPAPDMVLKTSDIQQSTATINADLPPGDYAFFLFDDLNGNKVLEKTALGFPDEPYAFSNNFQLGYAKPEWDQIKFKVRDTQVKQSVTLTNP